MRVLGISAFYHDSAAALIEDGEILAAVQEERFTRCKHEARLPVNAIHYCTQQHPGPLDAIVFYEKPLLKFERILKNSIEVVPRGFRGFASAMPAWLREKLWIPLQIERALAAEEIDLRGKIYFGRHHESHAASAFFPSPFASAAIVTIDGVGEWTTTSISHGEGNNIRTLTELNYPHSLGLLYSAFTYYCGFRVNSGEYKLMGLAPYGKPRYKETILRELIDLREDGSFRLNLDYFGYQYGQRMTNGRFHRLFDGAPRRPEAAISQRDCDLARSIQEVTEDAVLGIARQAKELTGERRLCMAGGVALNCVANGRLLREGPFEDVWVQPASGDAGGAVGAALSLYHMHFGRARRVDRSTDLMRGALLGPSYSAADIQLALSEFAIDATPLPREALLDGVANALAEGKVVGCFQGQAEFGPRALGNRSILADPRLPEMQSVLNQRIKKRESFRPFAPAVLAEHASEWFDLDRQSPYMLLTAPVCGAVQITAGEIPGGSIQERLAETRSQIPAVTHVDNSARVQTVDHKQHPEFHELLSAFYRRTGCPVLVNTSFNVRGEPPVCHPRDALRCFLSTDMDSLMIGAYLLNKSKLPDSVRAGCGKTTFAAD